ncbi:alpha/beta hydrolase [Schlegelella sp. S2-27]|uniref:Alpha/beta hydrolase n=1 Tax=Caldimonas mangrovi TaxID=2944811 RepID=A0ABT0YL36_9BURK|nr:alpha/beta hydrolase [Caldimonas mangrovi]MCM5679447.1 alpha/beta hydrolase [Caldimonas mangrovi]
MTTDTPFYTEHRARSSLSLPVRGLRYHVHRWGHPSVATPERPTLVMLHGWMDVGASFQFVVDAFAAERYVIAPDWRGFGLTETPNTDTYWFPDYLADLDALLDQLVPGQPIDLLGHSMGGNVAMLYAGVRPERVRRLVNLEGFGLPDSRPSQAPKRYGQWLDDLKTAQQLRSYDSLDAVAERLRKNNPLLRADRAAWLAAHWSRQDEHGRWVILGDPAHKRANPVLYRKEEVLACWERITAPVLWVEGDRTDVTKWWGDRYPRADFEARLAVVPKLERHVLSPAGHMLHHDQPEALAERIEAFLKAT